jgi:trans-aconitate 2-methyltransferase
MSSPGWDPVQYMRYAGERERPFWELVSRIQGDPPGHLVDLGCGTGTSTAALLARWPNASISGIDSSASMIERALTLAEPPRLTFELRDIRDFDAPPASLDLILSNAALHWVPGHVDLFARWIATLAAGGSLAFQVPRNFDQPSHLLLRRLAASPRWAQKLEGAEAALELPSVKRYYESLRALGTTVDAWETTYHHVLSGPDPVLEWVRGTALRPYLSALEDRDAQAFTDAYASLLRDAYPASATGETLLAFKRLFLVARKPA